MWNASERSWRKRRAARAMKHRETARRVGRSRQDVTPGLSFVHNRFAHVVLAGARFAADAGAAAAAGTSRQSSTAHRRTADMGTDLLGRPRQEAWRLAGRTFGQRGARRGRSAR